MVLHVNYEQAISFSDDEVLKRWSKLYPSSGNSIKLLLLNKESNELIKSKINQCTKNLYSISSFMKSFNQFIAVQFNSEDNCKGRFWEGRFKSKAIFSTDDLINVMSYVASNNFNHSKSKIKTMLNKIKSITK